MESESTDREVAPVFPSAPTQVSAGVAASDQHRAIQETQAALVIAKRFPRDQQEAYRRIVEACKRQTLAGQAIYVYPRGGTRVTGPSIRLAEALAQNWGNLQFGIRELSQSSGESEVEAFCWDLETNTRQVKVFKVPHLRVTREAPKGKPLSDPRDIYELVANNGARRLRACILGVIPGDVVEAAVKQCETTIEKGSDEPLPDRVRKMIVAFSELGVTKPMIEKRIGHKAEVIVPAELVQLTGMYKSIRDGFAPREDFFDVNASETHVDARMEEAGATLDEIQDAPQAPKPNLEEQLERSVSADDDVRLPSDPIGAGQLKALKDAVKSKKMTQAALDTLLAKYRATRLEEVTNEHYQAVLTEIIEWAPKKRQSE